MATRISAATKRAMAETLQAYYETHEEKKAIDREDRRLKKDAQAVPDGQFGNYLKTFGDGKLIMDQDAVAARFAELGEPVPMKMTNSMIVRKV